MKRVIKFETSDGKLHDTQEAATRHAEKRYGEQLSHMAAQIVRLEKYGAVQAYIDERLDVFETLRKMKDDCRLEAFEKDCDCE